MTDERSRWPGTHSKTRYLMPGAAAVLLILAVAGAGIVSVPVLGGTPANNTTGSMTDTAPKDNVSVGIDCNTSRVNVTAAAGSEYKLTLAVVNVTQSGTSTSKSSWAPLSGNVSVPFDGAGVVYVFVTNYSTGETVLTESRRCGELSGQPAANATGPPSIGIDCNESVVNFTAPANVSYTARVSSIDVSPTGTSSSSVSQTAQGNITVATDGGLVVASASTEATEEPVLAIRDCADSTIAGENATAGQPCEQD